MKVIRELVGYFLNHDPFKASITYRAPRQILPRPNLTPPPGFIGPFAQSLLPKRKHYELEFLILVELGGTKYEGISADRMRALTVNQILAAIHARDEGE